jgi:ribonuclease G
MSDFGLIQITRQRIRQNIVQAIKETCPVCHGTGLLTKSSHMVYDLETHLRKLKLRTGERNIIIKCHPSVAAKLREGKIKSLTKLQLKFLIRIKLQEDASLPADTFVFISGKTGDDLTKEIE